MLVLLRIFAEFCVDCLFMADLSKSVKELEALSTYPEPEGFHAKRLEALQAELKEASSSTAEQQAHIKQVINGEQVLHTGMLLSFLQTLHPLTMKLEVKMEALSERARVATNRKACMERMVATEEPMLR